MDLCLQGLARDCIAFHLKKLYKGRELLCFTDGQTEVRVRTPGTPDLPELSTCKSGAPSHVPRAFKSLAQTSNVFSMVMY